MSKSKRSSKKRNASRKRRSGSNNVKDFAFIDCPIGGAIFSKTMNGNGLHVFDRISFWAVDIDANNFETEGLSFDQGKGWYDPNAEIPKYYGQNVYEACMEYAVDRGIEDSLYLGLAYLGQKRSTRFVLRLDHSEIIKRMKDKTGCQIVVVDEKLNMKIA